MPKNPPKAHYKIEYTIDTVVGRAEGKEVIRFKNMTSRPICRVAILWSSAASMEITSKGKAVAVLGSGKEDSGIESFVIELPEKVECGDEGILEISFSFQNTSLVNINREPITGWYPRLWWGFETHDDFEVKVKASPEYLIGASGVLDKRTGYYRANGVRSFGLFIGKDFKSLEANAGDVTIRCLYSPKGEKCAQLVMSTAVDVVNYYRERFGFYPHSSLTIIPGSDFPTTGGYPVATSIVAIHAMEQMEKKDERHWRWITAHEIGHQYCGEHMLSSDPADSFDWLMLGLGIYADREYTRARNPGTTKHRGFADSYIKGVRAGFDTTINITAEQRSKIRFDFNNVVQHGKSSSVISALDCVLGKEVFSRVYQRCLKEFAGRRLGVSEFQTICEEEAGQDLGWFFEQWVNSNRYLSYKISSKSCEKEGEGYRSKVEVERIGDLRMPVPLAAYFEDGSMQEKFTERLLDVSVVEFESKAALKEVRLDPNGVLPLLSSPRPTSNSTLTIDKIKRTGWTKVGKAALKLFKEATEGKLSDRNSWFKLGMILYDGNYYKEGLEAFQRSRGASKKGSNDYFVSMVWEGHVLDLLGRRNIALLRYKTALKHKKEGYWVRHDQYGIVISREWVEERIKKPFERK
ncbi:MAG: hypothetical protein KAS75_02340 [Planctomycetes bacterium]|nr:hypothetical protein [Planctomycetota bacterium]